LEISDTVSNFEFLFTEFMFHVVFSRMESLKNICIVEQDHIPEVRMNSVVMTNVGFVMLGQGCLQVLELLRAKGIDVYRMKKRISAASF